MSDVQPEETGTPAQPAMPEETEQECQMSVHGLEYMLGYASGFMTIGAFLLNITGVSLYIVIGVVSGVTALLFLLDAACGPITGASKEHARTARWSAVVFAVGSITMFLHAAFPHGLLHG